MNNNKKVQDSDYRAGDGGKYIPALPLTAILKSIYKGDIDDEQSK